MVQMIENSEKNRMEWNEMGGVNKHKVDFVLKKNFLGSQNI